MQPKVGTLDADDNIAQQSRAIASFVAELRASGRLRGPGDDDIQTERNDDLTTVLGLSRATLDGLRAPADINFASRLFCETLLQITKSSHCLYLCTERKPSPKLRLRFALPLHSAAQSASSHLENYELKENVEQGVYHGDEVRTLFRSIAPNSKAILGQPIGQEYAALYVPKHESFRSALFLWMQPCQFDVRKLIADEFFRQQRLNRELINREISYRSFFRHELASSVSSFTSTAKTIVDSFQADETIQARLSSSDHFALSELSRQAKTINAKFRPLKKDPYDERWEPISRDPIYSGFSKPAVASSKRNQKLLENREYLLRTCITEASKQIRTQFGRTIEGTFEAPSPDGPLSAYIKLQKRIFMSILEEIAQNAAKYSLNGTNVYGRAYPDDKDRVVLELGNYCELIEASEQLFVGRAGYRASTALASGRHGSGQGLSRAKTRCQDLGGIFVIEFNESLADIGGPSRQESLLNSEACGSFLVRMVLPADVANWG